MRQAGAKPCSTSFRPKFATSIQPKLTLLNQLSQFSFSKRVHANTWQQFTNHPIYDLIRKYRYLCPVAEKAIFGKPESNQAIVREVNENFGLDSERTCVLSNGGPRPHRIV